MEALASVKDYSARYGEPSDAGRVTMLLKDASDLLMAAYEERIGAYEPGGCPAFDRAAPAVCCLLVNRVLSAPRHGGRHPVPARAQADTRRR